MLKSSTKTRDVRKKYLVTLIEMRMYYRMLFKPKGRDKGKNVRK